MRHFSGSVCGMDQACGHVFLQCWAIPHRNWGLSADNFSGINWWIHQLWQTTAGGAMVPEQQIAFFNNWVFGWIDSSPIFGEIKNYMFLLHSWMTIDIGKLPSSIQVSPRFLEPFGWESKAPARSDFWPDDCRQPHHALELVCKMTLPCQSSNAGISTPDSEGSFRITWVLKVPGPSPPKIGIGYGGCLGLRGGGS